MVIQSDKNSAQFNLRLEKVFGQNSATSTRLGEEGAQAIKDEIADLVASIREDVVKDLEQKNKDTLDKFLDEIFDSSTIEKGLSNAVDTALGQVLRGRELNARTIANSAARAFRPAVDEFFRESGAQIADELSSVLGLAQRNS